MTTPILPMRVANNGPFVGDPGIRVGPGSLGLLFRAHGDGTVGVTMSWAADTTRTAVVGMSAIAVNMVPGNKYSLQFHGEYAGSGMTGTAEIGAYYRLRDASTSSWGSWTAMTTATHSVNAQATTDTMPSGSFDDALFDLTVSASANAVEFCIVSDNASGLPEYKAGRCFAVAAEYAP